VDQSDVDMAVRLVDAANKELLVVNGPCGRTVPERFGRLVSSGKYRLIVRLAKPEKQGGEVTVDVRLHAPALPQQDPMRTLLLLAAATNAQRNVNPQQSLNDYRTAAKLWREQRDWLKAAEATYLAACVAHRDTGDADPAVLLADQAVELFAAAGESSGQIWALVKGASARGETARSNEADAPAFLNRLRRANADLDIAQTLASQLRRPCALAEVTLAKGHVAYYGGGFDRARGYYLDAERRFAALDEKVRVKPLPIVR
jgi:hypothetical protein